MKTFVKNYIGKGKQVAGLQIAKVTCKLEDLVKFAYEYDGTEYVTFEVAKMKNPDSYGRDYTVYVSQSEEVNEPAQKKASPKKAVKKSKKATADASNDDLPF
jgi:phage protein D